MTKACTRCGETKDATEFTTMGDKPTRCSRCRPCMREVAKERRLSGVDKTADRRRQLQKLYGISLEDWETMYDEQMGRCATCLIPLAECKIIATDHDHETGIVRGLLCNPCNLALGALKDDPQTIRRMLHYVEQVRDRKSLTVGTGGEL